MSLTPGTRLGSYEIVATVGAGGMGEVYRAKDTKLHRDVALKILSPGFMTDPDRRARFAREAHVLASLNHPHIAAIYGLEDSSDIHALAMEFVDGEDLSALTARGPIPLADALQYARQIAEALEAAHEQGVIHRDLKPANIKVRADGMVKVLDFGLAKALAPAEGPGASADNSPTFTAHGTQIGMILGTAAYMAPEQAKGRVVDRRADIWAFGVVLYEMVTGRRLFDAADVSETLAAVLTRDVSLTSMPSDIPPRLRALLRDCLIRDPKQRLRDIGDARLALDKIIAGAPDDAAAGASTAAPVKPKSRMLPWAIAAAALLAAAAMGWESLRGAPATPVPRVMHVTVPFGNAPGGYGGVTPAIAMSSDGATIVYVGQATRQFGLFLRRLDGAEPALIRGTEFGSSPFLSPDALWVGFVSADGRIQKVSIDGGVPIPICDATDARGASWGPDGFIVFTPNTQEGLWRVKDTGGSPPERLTTRDAAKHEKTHRLPDVLPNGKGVLFMIGTTESDSWDDATIAVLPASGGPPKELVKGGMMPRYVAPGYLVYAHGGDLVAAPFDLDRLEVTGPAVSVASDIAMTNTMGVAEAAVSSGALAYLPGHSSIALSNLIEVDRAGAARPLTHTPRNFDFARWLPDHQHIIAGIDSGNTAMWMFDTEREAPQRLTFGDDVTSLAWNRATGRAFFTGVGQILSIAVAGGKESVVHGQQGFFTDLDVSPDGQFVLFGELVGANERLWMLTTGTGKAELWAPSRFTQSQPRFSPDGRWVAYVAMESGPPQVFVRAARGGDARTQISSAPAEAPVWAPSGRELFYSDARDLWVADVRDPGRMEFGNPRRLFTRPARTGLLDVAPDGQHLLLLQYELPPAPSSITYISSWLEAIKAKAGRAR